MPKHKLSDYNVQIKITYSCIRVDIDLCKSDPHKANNSLFVLARVCIYVHMYVFMYVCVCTYVCMYAYMCLYVPKAASVV